MRGEKWCMYHQEWYKIGDEWTSFSPTIHNSHYIKLEVQENTSAHTPKNQLHEKSLSFLVCQIGGGRNKKQKGKENGKLGSHSHRPVHNKATFINQQVLPVLLSTHSISPIAIEWVQIFAVKEWQKTILLHNQGICSRRHQHGYNYWEIGCQDWKEPSWI